jgi:hypothetical protein
VVISELKYKQVFEQLFVSLWNITHFETCALLKTLRRLEKQRSKQSCMKLAPF